MQFLRSNNRSEELRNVLSNDHELASETDSIPDESANSSRIPYLATDIDLDANGSNEANSGRTLSTFAGVFCPVALSQFSTLLFMRMGFVVGQSGIVQFAIELVLAYLILLMTVLSICAISTNGEISGGGVYFMISRTLGPEFGGSIGLLFFIANIFACGLYVSGFTEGLVDNFGPQGYFGEILPSADFFWKYLYSLIVLLLCLGICLVGGSLFARTSAVILLVLLVSFGSVIASLIFHPPSPVKIPRDNTLAYDPGDNATLDPNYTVWYNFTGPRLATFLENARPHYAPDYTSVKQDASSLNFARVFAVLFSSVTGIMNGANLSGELRQPSRSIPLGTLLAVLFTFLTYLLLGLLIGSSCQYQLLLNNYGFLSGVNYWAPFVFIGVAAATLSAALGNLIGASRILAALAKDGIFGPALKPAAVTTRSGNPVPAVLIAFFLVLSVLLIGSLNTIAPIVSCFFLLSYASTNLACAALDLAGAPNFRPAFKLFHWGASLAGLIGCLVMSFLVSLLYTPISLMMLLGLIICLHLRGLPDSWGSITQALIYHQVRKYLLMLDLRKYHVKYWRPQILQLVANPRSSANAIQFVNHLKKGGLYVVGHVVMSAPGCGDGVRPPPDVAAPAAADTDTATAPEFEDPLDAEYRDWLAVVDFLRVKAFVEMTVAPSIRCGLGHLARLSGLGGMKPNTVCLGFYDASDPVNALAFKQLQQQQTRNRSRARFSRAASTDPSAGAITAATVADAESVEAGEASGTASASAADLIGPALRHVPPIRSGGHSGGGAVDDVDSSATSRNVRSPGEYVGMLTDVLHLGKNLLVTRGMDDAAPPRRRRRSRGVSGGGFGGRHANFIDVWPVNFMQPQLSGCMDATCLLQLQFACILHTVRAWRGRSRLRVFLCVDSGSRVARLTESLDRLLGDLRIRAQTHLLDWEQVLGENRASLAHDGEISRQYLMAVNQTIRLQSPTTAAVFLYLPKPPGDPGLHANYLENLDTLTKDLPPTVLVHGLHKVVSRNL